MCESTSGGLSWLAGGPEKKKSKYVDVCTFNSTGRPQLMDALNHCRRGRFTGPRCSDVDVPVAACLNQEHHARGDEWVDLKMSARKAGWNLVGAMAEPSKGSQGKAGAAIATRTAFHTGFTKGAAEDMFSEESPGRVATVWVDGIVRGGILIISIYLYDGEGLTTRNRAILFAAGEIIRRHGGPWVIGGDFNCVPQDIHEEMADWLKELGGELRAPGNLTCRSANGGRTIDFFILD